MALGAGETTLVRLTTAYAMLVNGGRRITPALIDRVQDRNGNTIYRHDQRACPDCRGVPWQGQAAPRLPDEREQVADPASAYQVVSMLQGVVERGTGRRVASVGKPLAGKTGTTNESQDAWFIGFSPDLAVGVFTGFDEPRTLGPKETGSSVAAPIFGDFMAEALADKPAIPFRIPPGIRLVRVNADTGRLAGSGDGHVILEAFKPGTVPTGEQMVLDGGYNPSAVDATRVVVPGGSDGLY
jgi:penicillin-binding protein 1A